MRSTAWIFGRCPWADVQGHCKLLAFISITTPNHQINLKLESSPSAISFIFFLISKNVIYTNGYSMHEEHRANPENTRRKTKKKQKKGTQSTN